MYPRLSSLVPVVESTSQTDVTPHHASSRHAPLGGPAAGPSPPGGPAAGPSPPGGAAAGSAPPGGPAASPSPPGGPAAAPPCRRGRPSVSPAVDGQAASALRQRRHGLACHRGGGVVGVERAGRRRAAAPHPLDTRAHPRRHAPSAWKHHPRGVPHRSQRRPIVHRLASCARKNSASTPADPRHILTSYLLSPVCRWSNWIVRPRTPETKVDIFQKSVRRH